MTKQRNPEATCVTCLWWEAIGRGSIYDQPGNCTGAPEPKETIAGFGCGIHQDAIIEDTQDDTHSG